MSNAVRATEILRRLGNFDFEGVREMLSPAFVQEYPYRRHPIHRPHRRARTFLEFCRNGMTAFEPYTFRISALYETTDHPIVIAEYTSHSRLLATNAPYSNAIHRRVRVRRTRAI